MNSEVRMIPLLAKVITLNCPRILYDFFLSPSFESSPFIFLENSYQLTPRAHLFPHVHLLYSCKTHKEQLGKMTLQLRLTGCWFFSNCSLFLLALCVISEQSGMGIRTCFCPLMASDVASCTC